jgi:hypothetical protein
VAVIENLQRAVKKREILARLAASTSICIPDQAGTTDRFGRNTHQLSAVDTSRSDR